jgi:NAD-dependent SIR2 family protein deacetylase
LVVKKDKNPGLGESSQAVDKDLDQKIKTVADWIAACHKLVVFTGAGISTDSGLPDFRGPEGVWTRRDKGLAPPKLKVPLSQIKPNPGHMAIVELQEMGKLSFLITQNVDNLHRQSGIKPDLLAELHGNTTLMKCLGCSRTWTKEEVGWDNERWGKGYRKEVQVPGQPGCPRCSGRLVSSVVNFGDSMPEEEMERSIKHSVECDLFIAAGSSLVVSPANHMLRYALKAGAKLILINRGQTPFDLRAHLRIWEGISQVLPPMVERVKRLT